MSTSDLSVHVFTIVRQSHFKNLVAVKQVIVLSFKSGELKRIWASYPRQHLQLLPLILIAMADNRKWLKIPCLIVEVAKTLTAIYLDNTNTDNNYDCIKFDKSKIQEEVT